jgi:hypothetical protein
LDASWTPGRWKSRSTPQSMPYLVDGDRTAFSFRRERAARVSQGYGCSSLRGATAAPADPKQICQIAKRYKADGSGGGVERALPVHPQVVGSWERGLQAPSGRFSVSKPTNLEHSTKAGE